MEQAHTRYINAFARECAADSGLLKKVFRSPPVSSVHHGAAGVALTLFKLSRARSDDHLLSLADFWIKHALRNIAKPTAFYNSAPDWDLTEKTIGKISLSFHESGVRFVAALIAARKDWDDCKREVAGFLRASAAPERRHELYVGQGGILFGCAMLLDALPDSETELRERVRSRGDQIFDEMIRFPKSGVTKTAREYLGIAHGRAGILYALLVWHDLSGRAVPPKLSAALKKLAEMGQEIGNAARWPTMRGGHEYWSGFCHGTAGYVFLWTLAARLLSHSGYLDLAAMAAEHTWQFRNPNLSLCCGAVGDGFAYLNLYRASGERVWLQRAKKSAERSTKIEGDSLFRGRAGVVALLGDLEQPKDSWMPLFERVS